jgi:hypothetical protein
MAKRQRAKTIKLAPETHTRVLDWAARMTEALNEPLVWDEEMTQEELREHVRTVRRDLSRLPHDRFLTNLLTDTPDELFHQC